MNSEIKESIRLYMTAIDPPAIAFDGCHKIYILLDDEQVKQSEEWGYNEDGSSMVYAKDATKEEMISTLIKWYEESCFLRFIDAVRTVKGDPNDGYITVIGQGEGDDDEEAEED